jgi:hypothetical protein
VIINRNAFIFTSFGEQPFNLLFKCPQLASISNPSHLESTLILHEAHCDSVVFDFVVPHLSLTALHKSVKSVLFLGVALFQAVYIFEL